MISGLLKKIFGSRNDRLIKQYSAVVRRINALEGEIAALSDDALRAKTDEFRNRLSQGQSLDDLLPEAFAVVREAGKRVLGMRHFDVQLIGGMVLHHGKIAEMRTGEGKTLVATLPSYLNALAGNGVHIVTVNDYLASRDAEWMGRLHRFLGLTVGCNMAGMDHAAKQAAFACDITYGTNNEFGFDYLRDNMVYSSGERVQRKLNYAIVDEVDSILIDEARTPLIISGQAEDRTELYVRMNQVAPMLTRCVEENGPGDYWVDEKGHQVLMTEAGHEHAEEVLERVGLLPAGTSLQQQMNKFDIPFVSGQHQRCLTFEVGEVRLLRPFCQQHLHCLTPLLTMCRILIREMQRGHSYRVGKYLTAPVLHFHPLQKNAIAPRAAQGLLAKILCAAFQPRMQTIPIAGFNQTKSLLENSHLITVIQWLDSRIGLIQSRPEMLFTASRCVLKSR